MNLKFLELALDAQHVVRYHADKVFDRQTVGNHTFGVLCIADYITEGRTPAHVMRALLLHDVPEAATGDLPYAVKLENSALKEAMDAAEAKVFAKAGVDQPRLEGDEYALYKFCDLAEAGFQAVRELSFGNRNALSILDKVVDGLLVQQRGSRYLNGARFNELLDILNETLIMEQQRWD